VLATCWRPAAVDGFGRPRPVCDLPTTSDFSGQRDWAFDQATHGPGDEAHVYLHVQDGAEVERFLRTLHERCWLAGFGWHMVGAGGQLLDRSIVDRMVLPALNGYLTGQSNWMVNYAERHRAGLRVGSAITEGKANFLVNRQMNKSQQLRWSRRDADLLLPVRCAVYNGTLGSGFGQRFRPADDTYSPPAIAA
jgi:hypothetical protein